MNQNVPHSPPFSHKVYSIMVTKFCLMLYWKAGFSVTGVPLDHLEYVFVLVSYVGVVATVVAATSGGLGLQENSTRLGRHALGWVVRLYPVALLPFCPFP